MCLACSIKKETRAEIQQWFYDTYSVTSSKMDSTIKEKRKRLRYSQAINGIIIVTAGAYFSSG